MENINIAPFYQGEKVVCVDNGYIRNGLGRLSDAPELVNERIYTVAKLIPPYFEQWGVVLVEVKSIHPTGAFLASRFAPIHPQFLTISYSKVLEVEVVSVN